MGRMAGYQVFHDVQFERRNVDHVVVGPKGVFALETKTRRKPFKEKNRVAFDGEAVWIAFGSPMWAMRRLRGV
jgi:hypothetical protein